MEKPWKNAGIFTRNHEDLTSKKDKKLDLALDSLDLRIKNDFKMVVQWMMNKRGLDQYMMLSFPPSWQYNGSYQQSWGYDGALAAKNNREFVSLFYIYIYICIYVYVCIYIYIYIFGSNQS